VLAETDREGLFKITTWVNDILVRTTTDIDDITFTYTSAMNLEDNSTLADEIEFRLSNFITTAGMTYESDQAIVVVKKN